MLTQSCLTFCDPLDCSLPGSSVHGFSRQEYWSGLPISRPGDLPNPRIKPKSFESSALTGGFFITGPCRKTLIPLYLMQKLIQEIPTLIQEYRCKNKTKINSGENSNIFMTLGRNNFFFPPSHFIMKNLKNICCKYLYIHILNCTINNLSCSFYHIELYHLSFLQGRNPRFS